ncbi:unnamed protein product, partial [Closterium sp. NIES-64]
AAPTPPAAPVVEPSAAHTESLVAMGFERAAAAEAGNRLGSLTLPLSTPPPQPKPPTLPLSTPPPQPNPPTLPLSTPPPQPKPPTLPARSSPPRQHQWWSRQQHT